MVLNDTHVKWQEEAPLGIVSPDGNQVKLDDHHGYTQVLDVIYYNSNTQQVACVCLEGLYYYQIGEEWLSYDEVPFPSFNRYPFDFAGNHVQDVIKQTQV
ncbi:hypothetical protein BKI52_44540 [marine bacterium AO1-C]|nr:hypothetical protein BKI52_44540 [marine bacterium AO1-C]